MRYPDKKLMAAAGVTREQLDAEEEKRPGTIAALIATFNHFEEKRSGELLDKIAMLKAAGVHQEALDKLKAEFLKS